MRKQTIKTKPPLFTQKPTKELLGRPPGQLSPLLINYTHRVHDWWSPSLCGSTLWVFSSGSACEEARVSGSYWPKREGGGEGDDYLTSGGASVFDQGYRQIDGQLTGFSQLLPPSCSPCNNYH